MNDGTLTFDNLLCDVRGLIATVTLNRPKVLNALNAATFDDLESVFGTLAAEDSVRVILLTGSGEKAFAAGADINELAAADGPAGQKISERGQQVFLQIENCGKPVIACVNGFALGGGCELALCADYIFAAEHAKFGQPETNLGLMPGFGGTQRLSRRVGLARARELVYSAEPISAAQALVIGLANRVLPISELMTQCEQHARRIAQQAPLAVAASKRALNHGYDADLASACELEATAFGALFATEDAQAGLTAFLEKRRATYQAR